MTVARIYAEKNVDARNPAPSSLTNLRNLRFQIRRGSAATIFATASSILRALLSGPSTTAVPVPRKTSLLV